MIESNVFPTVQTTLAVLGENIKLGRFRRKLSAEQVAERANISRKTLYSIEQGASGVSIGHYAMVLSVVLGLERIY